MKTNRRNFIKLVTVAAVGAGIPVIAQGKDLTAALTEVLIAYNFRKRSQYAEYVILQFENIGTTAMAALDTSLYTGKAIHLEKQHNDCAGYQCSAKFHGKVVAISREIVGIGQMNCSVELCRIDGQEEPLAHFAFTS